MQDMQDMQDMLDMRDIGDRNWHTPGRLSWLPRISHGEGVAPFPERRTG